MEINQTDNTFKNSKDPSQQNINVTSEVGTKSVNTSQKVFKYSKYGRLLKHKVRD